MFLSQSCTHAIRALSRLHLLQRLLNRPVRVAELCDGQDLPETFVAKIFQQLVKQGLLTSVRGRQGGFRLARAAEEIHLIDIVQAIEGPLKDCNACVSGLATCSDTAPCPLHERFKPIREQMKAFMLDTTLAEMGDAVEAKLKAIGAGSGSQLGLPSMVSPANPAR